MEINDIPGHGVWYDRGWETYSRCDGLSGTRKKNTVEPSKLVYDIVNVQPMTGPSNLIFAMRSKYGK